MFLGTTPAVVAQYIERELKRIQPKRVWVPFAGNFVFEQIVAGVSKEIDIQSTDVSVYSRLIGFGLAGKECDMQLLPEHREVFPEFASSEPVIKAASAIFFSEVATAMLKRRIPYYDRLYKQAVDEQKKYREKIVAKVNLVRERLGSFTFHGTDACPLLDQVKEGDVVLYDPPYWVEGYKQMFAGLDSMYENTDVSFIDIDEGLKLRQLQEMQEKGAIVYYRSFNERTDLPEIYQHVFRYDYDFSKSWVLYCNREAERFVGSKSLLNEESKMYPVIMPEDTITENSKVEIVPCKGGVANHYRLLWVKKVAMTNGGDSFLVLIDGKVAGVANVRSGLAFSIELATIFSDPAALSTKYKRLGKLIIMLICSKEFLAMFNDKTMWEHVGFTTAVFTNADSSMKYRGIFKLVKREKADRGVYKNKLMYQNRDKIWDTYSSALKSWVKKYGSDVTGESISANAAAA